MLIGVVAAHRPGGRGGPAAGTLQEPSGLAAWVSAASFVPGVAGCSGVPAGKPSGPTTECRSLAPWSATASGQIGVFAAISHWWLRNDPPKADWKKLSAIA